VAGDRALVIGVAQYATLADQLPGGVADALRITNWLISDSGGRIRPRNVKLLLSRRPEDTKEKFPAPENVTEREATFDDLSDAANELVAQEGARLFVYFSGHGVTDPQSGEPVLLLQGYRDDRPQHSMTLRSLMTRLQAAKFPVQHVWIDACRDIARPTTVNWAKHGKGNDGVKPVPQQFPIFATSPGLMAQQLQSFQRETGAFTLSLLDALEGRGAATVVDEERLKTEDKLRYVLTYESLFRTVCNSVKAHKLEVDQGFIQVPSKGILENQDNPEIVVFDVDMESAADRQRFMRRVRVTVAPPEAPLRSLSFEGAIDHEIEPTPTGPWDVELFLSTYFVRAKAPGFVLGAAAWPKVPLWAPVTDAMTGKPADIPDPWLVTVELRPDAKVIKTNGGIESTGFEELVEDTLESAAPRKHRVTVTARSEDPQASIEIWDDSGIRAMASGKVTVVLWPGTYHARLRRDAGDSEPQPFVVDGSASTLTVDVMSPPPAPEIRQIAHGEQATGEVAVSERLGWLASPDETMLLALSATTALPGHGADNLERIRSADSVRAALPCGIALLTRGDVQLEPTTFGDPIATGRTAHFDATWSSWRLVPESYPVRARFKVRSRFGESERAVDVPLRVLEHHVTLVIVDVLGERPELVQLWLPAAGGASLPNGPDEWRGAVMAQRALARGDVRWAREILRRDGGLADPARILLRFALAAATDTPENIHAAAQGVVAAHPELADGHCGLAIAARAQGQPHEAELALAQHAGMPATRIAFEDMRTMEGAAGATDLVVPGWPWTALAVPT
jgi:hypothetical protein